MKRLVSVRCLVGAALLVPALALAQPKTADDWYKEGETQYNLGEFDKAAEAFKQGFAAEPDESKKPAYLYNVAQAYRQANRCRDASFFYKRYLVLKDQDTEKPLKPEKRAEIEQRIAELDECAKTQPATPPPTGPGTGTTTTTTKTTGPGTTTTTKPTGPGTTTTTTTPTGPTVGQGGDEEEEEEEEEGELSATFDGTQPSLVSARLLMGGAYVGMGDLDVGVRGAFGLIAGYPVLRQDKLLVEAGVAFTYTPVVYRNKMTDASQNSSLIGAMANAGAAYTVAPRISARGDLGLGILSFSGLDMGNPFTENAAATTGALTTFAFRVGVSADFAITPNLVATATPFAFMYSPAKSGLRSDISAITKIEFMVGVGYRM